LQKEAGFKYTQDQNVSIKKILENLDSTTPMDHLLIGDVGFGKTEIAINAIFSVIKNGFQVAFVVPTTLLAKQHFSTIQKRFQNFGIEIAHIDKFVKAKERRETTQKVKEGKIDLVIGTHTILDFEFHKLALLIIDEEHKFGVKQKTKLQEKYSNIHLLSMSATPIPRTLNQALSKLKTTSRLEQSPKGRIPIKTFLREFDEVILKDAILKELKRDGQVFYIFNSIQDIENKKVEILNVLPHIKILVLHSKISPRIMEVEILRFEKGEYDVLLSTTIIGTGIHIPNVNTMIIDDAEKFGMADLHQLRGRVGRGKNEGFCYFFVEDMSKLRNMENASKRLLALEEHSSLGAGSSLAMHDLEIRGGGNIVGENQSGHIDDIGYSLYVQILEEELKKVTFQGGEEKKQIDIQLSIEAFISPLVVSDERAKLEIYRRTTNAKTTDEVEKIQNELKDRFGQLDVHTNQFFDLIKIRILGENIGVKSVSNMQKNISIIFHNGNRDVLVSPTRDDDDILETVLNFLSEFQN
jgi:transcription-repair coupling factor (superfamily II helicase)